MRAQRCGSFGVLVCLAVTWPLVAQAEPAAKPKVVVVTDKGPGGPNLARDAKLVEAALKPSATIVPLVAYRKAAAKAKIKPRELAELSTARVIAKDLGLTHVVVVEGTVQDDTSGKKKKKVMRAEVALIDVATGEMVFNGAYPLPMRRLTKPIVAGFVTELLAKLAPPAASASEPIAAAPVAEAVVPPPPEAPPALEPPAPPVAPAPSLEPPPQPTMAASQAPAVTPEAPPASEPAVAPAPEPPAEVSVALPAPSPAVEAAPSEETARSARPGARIMVGPSYVQRTGRVSASGSDDLEYTGPLVGARFALEFYPLALGGSGRFIEGIGVHAEATVARVETEFSDGVEAITSNVFAAEGGLSLRIAFGGDSAPDFTAKAGYTYTDFPLKSGMFPGTRYSGVYAGGTVTVPVSAQLGVSLGGYYVPVLTPSGKLERLADVDGAAAFRGELAVRLALAPVEVVVGGRFQQYDVTFKGTSSLGLAAELTDAEFSDRYVGGFASVGVAF